MDEDLSRMIVAATNMNIIKGFHIARSAPLVSHLQFADDTSVFCDAEEDQVMNLKAILLCFDAVSGPTVSLQE